MKIPDGPVRYTTTTAKALYEIADLIDGEQDERGLEAPTGLTAQEVVEVAVMELAREAERDPERVVGALVDRRLYR